MNEVEREKNIYRWLVVIGSFYCMFIAYGPQTSFGIFLKPILTEFGWMRGITSGVFTLYMIVHGLGYILMGKLTDRYGLSKVIALGGFITGIGLLMCSNLSSIEQFYMFYGIIMAIGIGAFFAPITANVAKIFSERRGLMLGIVLSGTGVGSLVMSPTVGYFISVYGWRFSFIIFSMLAWSTILTSILMRHDRQIARKNNTEMRTREWTMQEATKTNLLWMVFLTNLLFMISSQMVIVHIVAFATDIGITMVNAAGALGLIGGFSVIGRIGMGIISDKIGRRYVLIICLILQAVTILWLMKIEDTWMLYSFAIVFGFSWGGCIPQFPAITREIFGAKSIGGIFGLIAFGATTGGGIGPLIAGYVFDITLSYLPAFSLSFLIYVISALLVFNIKKKKNATTSQSRNRRVEDQRPL